MSESTTYLTVEQATAYLQFPTVNAFRHWVRAHGVPKFRRGGRTLLFLRRDLDEAIGNTASRRRQEAHS